MKTAKLFAVLQHGDEYSVIVHDADAIKSSVRPLPHWVVYIDCGEDKAKANEIAEALNDNEVGYVERGLKKEASYAA